MPRTGSRLLLASGSLVAAGALALAAPATSALAGGHPAQTDRPDRGHARNVVNVPISNTGFSLPKDLRAGYVTFKATTTDPTGHTLQGFQLHQGVSLAKVDKEFRAATSSNPKTAAWGIRALMRDITAVGGPTVEPSTAVWDTIPLTRGTYWFVDLSQYFAPGGKPRFHKVEVEGKFCNCAPKHSAVIAQVNTKEGPRFKTRDSLELDGTFLIVNLGDEIHEAVFQRVKPGVTDRKLQQVFDQIVLGKTPKFNPFAEAAQRGVAAMSPGRVQFLHFSPRSGRYALLCFIPDEKLGIPHAFLGMHKIVRLH